MGLGGINEPPKPEYMGQALLGWKVFKTGPTGTGLYARYVGIPIRPHENPNVPGEFLAQCAKLKSMSHKAQKDHGKGAPVEFCKCGFWAMWHEEGCYGEDLLAKKDLPQWAVVTLVWGYGRWFANDLSWRAERMRIAAFSAASPTGHKALEGHSRLHNAPILSAVEMREYASYAGANLAPEEPGGEKEIWLPDKT